MSAVSGGPQARHLAAVAMVSAAMLAFEVLLLRLFEFSHWHHFAGFAIAIALLGLGASGTVLALAGNRAVRAGDRGFHLALAVMAGTLLFVIWLQSRVALRPLFAVWDPGELTRVLAVDLAAMGPFLAAGFAIGQSFMRWPEHAGRLYGANLLGSALGSVAASLLLLVLQVEQALATVALALSAAGLCTALAGRLKGASMACLVASLASVLLVTWTPQPAVSDFKSLSRLRDLPDARVLMERPGLKGRLTLVRSDSLRFAPGLSLGWRQPVSPMDAAVVGSDRLVPVPRPGISYGHGESSLAGLPLALRTTGPVLALGSSEWRTPPLAAGRDVTWVESDRRLVALGNGVGGVPADPYRYLHRTGDRFPLISLDGSYAEADASSESYLLTVDGIALALSRLTPDGLLAWPLAVNYPPRHAPKAMHTLRRALERNGADRPGDHVAILRGMQDLLLLASPRPLTERDARAISDFAERWRFDLAWLPAPGDFEPNRFHHLPRPVFHEAAGAVFGGGDLPHEATWFTTAPADRSAPYFWRAVRWSRVPALADALGTRALSLLDWSLVLGAAATVAVLLAGFVLILAPLGRLPRIERPMSRGSVAAYFTALGVGYLFLELALFQRAVLYLGEPVLAASVIFAVFLAGSGAGSLSAPSACSGRSLRRIHVPLALGLVVAVAGFWLPAGTLLAASMPVRLTLVCAALLPLAWAMGRPFPWGLRQVGRQPEWVPWAWGINGLASVLGASTATLLSVHFGQPATVVAGTACYLAALGVSARWAAGSGRELAFR